MYKLRLPPVSGYTKLFSSILHSTIWREPNHVRIVWITLLAMAGKTGVADTSIPGLADAARVPLSDCEDALRRLQDPDPYSRTGDLDGRRIEPVDGGWRLVNHGKYRAKMGADERREYLRIKQAERRKRTKSVNTASTLVNTCNDPSTELSHTEAEATPEANTKARTKNVSSEPSNGSEPTTARVTFSTIGTGASTWGLTQAQIDAWRSAYPALDVLQECLKARVWVEAQPSRRKTARGMPRFLVGWLNRSADHRPAASSYQASLEGHSLSAKTARTLGAAAAILRKDGA